MLQTVLLDDLGNKNYSSLLKHKTITFCSIVNISRILKCMGELKKDMKVKKFDYRVLPNTSTHMKTNDIDKQKIMLYSTAGSRI